MDILKRVTTQRSKVFAGVLMVLIVAMPYTIIRMQEQDKKTEIHAATCTPDALLVNPCRPWLGAWAHDYSQAGSGVRNQIEYHEQRIGRQVDLVKDYKTQGGQLSADDKYFINRTGTYLVMTWKPASNFSAGGGGSSAVNSDIDAMADSIKSVSPKKIFLSVWHEPENDVSPGTSGCSNAQGNSGSPAQYRQMWQNVRNRFNARGVNNVVWTFMPMGYSGWNCLEKDMWPGNGLVDWVMWDPYGSGDNDSWNKTMSTFYNWMEANTDASHAYTSKVWGIAEVSIHWHAQEASATAFWQGAKAAIEANTFPRLKAYMVFDSLNGKPDNRIMYWCKQWSGETCAAGQTAVSNNEQNAYKAFANSATITGSGGGGGGGDATAPAVSISSPANGATISGIASVAANASDNTGVTKVVFMVDGVVKATDTGSPYSMTLDTSQYTNGNHTVSATAYDAAGNTKVTQISVSVQNAVSPPGADTSPPTASITSPTDGATVSGKVTVSASATDNVGIAKVVFTVDGTAIATDTAAPYSAIWDTALYVNGSHIVRAKAYDAAGNTRTPQKTVTVQNSTPPPIPTINSFAAQPASVTVGGRTTLVWGAANAANCSIDPNGPQRSTLTSWTTSTYVTAATQAYTLTCYNIAGQSVNKKVSVTVAPAPTPPARPIVTASQTTVAPGGNVLLSWSSAGAGSCILNPGGSTNTGSSGSKLISGLQQSTTFTVECSNNAGKSSASLRIGVSKVGTAAQPLIVNFTASPTNLSSGGRTTLTWSTTNVAANGCALAPSPLSSTAANGSWQSSPLAQSVSFTLTCKDAGGRSVSKSLGVTVNGVPAPAAPTLAAPATPAVSSAALIALGGQKIINVQVQGTVNRGQLITLDPSNVVDARKIVNISRVEYYRGEKLIKTVEEPPYALNTKLLQAGTHVITERTYYLDGSSSERIQEITVKETAAVTPAKNSGMSWLVWTTVIVLMLGAGALIVRKIRQRRAAQFGYDATIYQPLDVIIVPPKPDNTPQGQQSPYGPRNGGGPGLY